MRLDEVQNKGYNQKFIMVKPESAIQKNRRIQAMIANTVIRNSIL